MSEEKGPTAAPPAAHGEFTLSDEQIAVLKKKYKDIYVADTDLDGVKITLAFRYPKEPEIRHFMGQILPGGDEDVAGDQLYAASRIFVTDCLLNPGINQFNELVDRRPGLIQELAKTLQKAVTPRLKERKNA